MAGLPLAGTRWPRTVLPTALHLEVPRGVREALRRSTRTGHSERAPGGLPRKQKWDWPCRNQPVLSRGI